MEKTQFEYSSCIALISVCYHCTDIFLFLSLKPYIDIEGIDYDSNNSDSSDEELDEYYDDDMYDDTGPFAQKKKPKVPLPGEAEHSDPNSYSWCLMRYVILKFVVQKFQNFLPLSGIELAGMYSFLFFFLYNLPSIEFGTLNA